MSQYELDGLLVRTKRLFPILYQEALMIGGKNYSVSEFTTTYTKRVRRAGLPASQIRENLMMLPDTLIVWVTTQEIADIRQLAWDFLLLQEQVRLVYILKIQEIPVWGCVQIPNSLLDLQKARKQLEINMKNPISSLAEGNSEVLSALK